MACSQQPSPELGVHRELRQKGGDCSATLTQALSSRKADACLAVVEARQRQPGPNLLR